MPFVPCICALHTLIFAIHTLPLYSLCPVFASYLHAVHALHALPSHPLCPALTSFVTCLCALCALHLCPSYPDFCHPYSAFILFVSCICILPSCCSCPSCPAFTPFVPCLNSLCVLPLHSSHPAFACCICVFCVLPSHPLHHSCPAVEPFTPYLYTLHSSSLHPLFLLCNGLVSDDTSCSLLWCLYLCHSTISWHYYPAPLSGTVIRRQCYVTNALRATW